MERLVPLTEEGHENDHVETVAGSGGVEELLEVPPRVVVASSRHVANNFADLKLDDRRLWVTFAMVLGQDGNGLLSSVFHDEPAGRFCLRLIPRSYHHY